MVHAEGKMTLGSSAVDSKRILTAFLEQLLTIFNVEDVVRKVFREVGPITSGESTTMARKQWGLLEASC